MTHPDTLTIPRAVVEQALEIFSEHLIGYDEEGFTTNSEEAETVDNLRAALQPQAAAEPVFCKVLPELPKPSKVRRQARINGGYDMVAAYTEEEMYKYGEQCATPPATQATQAAITAALQPQAAQTKVEP